MKHICLIITAIFFSSQAIAATAFSLYGLTCEFEANPAGVETTAPRFSWKCNRPERGYVQSAYQIMAYEAGKVIWDSGKVKSENSVLIPYSGQSLKSFGHYEWKVRAWDEKGRVSQWSEIQRFSMGILSESDWQGRNGLPWRTTGLKNIYFLAIMD